MYVNKEIAKKLTMMKLKNMKSAYEMFDGVIDTLAKFDGKQINKRIETALKKNVCANIRVRIEYNTFEIYCSFFDNRAVKGDNGNWYYLNSYDETLCHACIESGYGDGIRNNDGLFDYEVAKKQTIKWKECYKVRIKEVTEQLEKIDEIIEEYENLNKLISKFNNKINPTIKDMFEFNGLDAYNWTKFE